MNEKYNALTLSILQFLGFYIFWYCVLFIIGKFALIPCYYPDEHVWGKCYLIGIQISKLTVVYFNNRILELLYVISYNLILPIILSFLTIKTLKRYIKIKKNKHICFVLFFISLLIVFQSSYLEVSAIGIPYTPNPEFDYLIQNDEMNGDIDDNSVSDHVQEEGLVVKVFGWLFRR